VTSDRIPRWHPLVLVSLALSAWVYFPITRVYFYADDWIHLLAIANDGPLAFILLPFGGHPLLASNLVFAICYELFGLHSEPYYWLALLSHLLNVSLLFATLYPLTRSAPLACFGAALWGTSPLAVSTIGWFSVYGQVMVAALLLVVLAQVTRSAATGASPTARAAGLWYALLVLGVATFGTGTGVALAFPAVIFLLLPSTWRRPRLRTAYLALPLVTLAAYYASRRLYLLVAPLPFAELLQESLAERASLRVVLPVVGHLLGFSVASVVLGFFRPPYPSPACWAAIAAFCAGVGLVVWRGDGLARRAALAMVALATTIYVVIALGRASIYTALKIPPWAIAGYARYHYAATIPIVVLLCLILQHASRRLRRPLLRSVALVAGLALIVAGRLQSTFAIDEHVQGREYVAKTLRDIDSALAAKPSGAILYLDNEKSPLAILGPVVTNPAFPGRAALFLVAHPSSDVVDGQHVRFIEPDHQLLASLAGPGRRLIGLLVAPKDVPPQP
jgi:hypothetical protein